MQKDAPVPKTDAPRRSAFLSVPGFPVVFHLFSVSCPEHYLRKHSITNNAIRQIIHFFFSVKIRNKERDKLVDSYKYRSSEPFPQFPDATKQDIFAFFAQCGAQMAVFIQSALYMGHRPGTRITAGDKQSVHARK